jgi:hypothetical protein
MKTVVSLTVRVRAVISFIICAGCWIPSSLHAQPQINSWTNSTSGKWEDANWSLGELPGTNQTILLTNAGWKALAIDPSTAENFPDSLSVDSVTISSPAYSFNRLLLNYSGFQTPLIVRSLSIDGNSAMTMLSSALCLTNGAGLQLGGEFDQTDSTVSGNQIIVGDIGPGIYNLNSGILAISNLRVDGPGSFTQLDGTMVAGTVGIYSTPVYLKGGGGEMLDANFALKGGTLTCSNMEVWGGYHQTGGTNFVAGDLVLSGYFVVFDSSGTLCANNFYSRSQGFSPIDISGTVIITNELRMDVGSYQSSGDLTVSNVTLTTGTKFSFTGGKISQSGILSVENAGLFFDGPGTYNLGPLLLNSGTNTALSFSPDPCILQFVDSSGIIWSNVATLTISNWFGSPYGGGQNQIIFGTHSDALTTQQLSQIQFQNPTGLAPGNYPVRILATGEIVPDTGAPLPPMINLNSTNGTMQLHVGGDIGQTYGIDVSTDLVHWLTWTSQLNTNGTISIEDDSCASFPQRFYRARALP